MAKVIDDVMTKNPVSLQATATAVEAARLMRDRKIGDVIVLDDGQVCGIVTDRDIVVRGLAEKGDANIKLGDICSQDLVSLEPDSRIGEAIKLMEEKALRRLPVVEGGKPVGIVSLGDLAVETDQKSALGQISAAPPNN
jgi:CBS domain-containing protein